MFLFNTIIVKNTNDNFCFYIGTMFGNVIVEVFRDQNTENSGDIRDQYLNIFILFHPQLADCNGKMSNMARLVRSLQEKNPC